MITTPINSVLDRMVTLSQAMDQALGPDTLSNLPAQAAWMPALDAWETESGYLVQVDLPGVKPEDVEIEFEKNTLTIRGTRSAKHDTSNGKRVFFAERDWGTFWRSLRFPQHVEGDNISAAFDNGVLTVTVPKAESAKPRRIAIMAPAQISG